METNPKKRRGRPPKSQEQTPNGQPSTPAHRNTAVGQRILLEAILAALREGPQKADAENWESKTKNHIISFTKALGDEHTHTFVRNDGRMNNDFYYTWLMLKGKKGKSDSGQKSQSFSSDEISVNSGNLSRLLLDLKKAGCPYHYDRKSNTYHLDNKYWELPIRMDLSMDDQMALCLGRQLLHTLDETSAAMKTSEQAIDQIDAKFGDRLLLEPVTGVGDTTGTSPQMSKELLYKLLQAIKTGSSIKLTPPDKEDSASFLAVPKAVQCSMSGTWVLRYLQGKKEGTIPLPDGVRNTTLP